MDPNKDPHVPEKPDGGLSDDKRYFKAVSNYMANVLGLDRNEIYKMLAEKIEARNVDQAVLEAVTRYFGFGPNGFGHESHVKDRLDKAVDEHVKDMFRKGAGAWMDRLIQERLEEMAGNARLSERDAARSPSTAIKPRPGLYVYQTGAWLDLALFNAVMSEWFEANLSRQQHPFSTELRRHNQFWHQEVSVTVRNLTKDDIQALNSLDGDRLACWATEAAVTEKTVKKILAGALGWPEVSRLVAGTDGVAAFPPETL